MISVFRKLYRGENDWNIIGRSRLFVGISLVAMALSLLSLFTQGLTFGIDFKGGSQWTAPVSPEVDESDVRGALEGLADAEVVFVTEDGQRKVRVSSQSSDTPTVDRVRENLSTLPGSSREAVEVTSVGPSWGAQISRRAVQALVIFLVLVTIYITLRFEWKMALGALSALAHDSIITAGVYSLIGFTVVPESVIAFLTILGYSLYDGVVVYDKVQENTEVQAQAARRTYSDTVNASLNQVLMRSLNTSISSLIPVGCVLLVGLTTSAAETLTEFALALFIGLLVGTYSSVFFATPILVMLKEREPKYKAIRARVGSRRDRDDEPVPAAPLPAEEEAEVEAEAKEAAKEAAVPARSASRPSGQPPRRKPAGSRPTSGRRKPGGGKKRR